LLLLCFYSGLLNLILKSANKLEKIPENASVLIDATMLISLIRILLKIEDFAIHTPLKNIRVEVKQSDYWEQGSSKIILNDRNKKVDVIRKPETILETIEP
jgi:hypothetical protein